MCTLEQQVDSAASIQPVKDWKSFCRPTVLLNYTYACAVRLYCTVVMWLHCWIHIEQPLFVEFSFGSVTTSPPSAQCSSNSTSIWVAPISFHTRIRPPSDITKAWEVACSVPTSARADRLQVRCFFLCDAHSPARTIPITASFCL